jgi:serine/threonine protein kinase
VTVTTSWHLTEGDEIAPGLLAMSRLGGGRAYEAYLAWSERLYAHVVVKLVRPDQVDDRRTLRGLGREVAMLDRLDHPVVVRSFGAVLDGPRPHVVLEHLDGPRLSSLLRRHGPLPLEQLLPLALQICSALHYLAGQDVVHLDVKPSNVIMGSTPRLIDLSIARTREEAAALDHLVGTDDYLAPEQCDPPATGSPGPPSDVWGLGATLYRAATGHLPFDVEGASGRSGHERWPQLTEAPASLPRHLPDSLAKPLLACLDRDPSARPTAAELAAELEPLVIALPKPVLGGVRTR